MTFLTHSSLEIEPKFCTFCSFPRNANYKINTMCKTTDKSKDQMGEGEREETKPKLLFILTLSVTPQRTILAIPQTKFHLRTNWIYLLWYAFQPKDFTLFSFTWQPEICCLFCVWQKTLERLEAFMLFTVTLEWECVTAANCLEFMQKFSI